MDIRIYYAMFSILITRYVNSCSVQSTDEKLCTYTLTCENYVDNFGDWRRFEERPQGNRYQNDGFNDDECERLSNNYAYFYPVYLVLKLNNINSNRPVPQIFEQEYVIDVIHGLDLSNNNYRQTPLLSNMINLAKLNLSRNHLQTALLSNVNELPALTVIDLSYNEVINIEINYNDYLYKTLIDIDLSHNHLAKIPNNVFVEFNRLQKLDLSHNFIDTLSLNAFGKLRNIVDLNLSNNRLTDINSSFIELSALKNLNLSRNRLKDIKMLDFKQLNKLETLDLSSNMIKLIRVDAFIALGLLKKLDLSNNQLEVVDNNAFSTLLVLSSLNLSKNKLKALPKDLFKNSSIHDLFIEDNILDGSLGNGIFEGINVTKLDLSNQFLTDVEDFAFYNLDSLEILHLNSNNIQSLAKMSFKTLRNLQHLELSNNKISNIDFNKEDLKNLRSLVLKNNNLTEIKQENFQFLTGLQVLDLSNNNIFRLEPKSFQSLNNLITLNINENPLVGTLEAGTFDGLVLLPKLDVSRNMLTMLQNASFSDMHQLKELNVSGGDISKLQYNTFAQTGLIETLDLSYNKLADLFINTTDLLRLSTILLNNNLIKTLNSYSLNGLSQLNKIVLSHNVMEDIHNESLNSLIALRHLDLSSNNKLNFSVAILKGNENLNILILSGVKSRVDFSHFIQDSLISELRLSNTSICNIRDLNLSKMHYVDFLDLSYNKITKLEIGELTGLNELSVLDLSFNQIAYIQPGVFQENAHLNSLNISHNSLSSVGYGIFNGLIHLSVLDMSYNNIESLETERIYELKGLKQLTVDFNNIKSLSVTQFLRGNLTKLSLGNNPLPCQILVKLKIYNPRFKITAINIDEHSNENVDGVVCNDTSRSKPLVGPKKVVDNNSMLQSLRNILYNFTTEITERENREVIYLEKISNLLELSYSKLTPEVVSINNNTNIMFNKIITLLQKRLPT